MMRKLAFVILVSCLLITLLFAGKENVLPVKASPDIYQGDLILTGNNVTTIEGQFDINGSIIVEDNATLILRNAIVNFTQVDHHQFNMTFQEPANGNPRLLVENATLTSHYSLDVYFDGNSSCLADKINSWPSLESSHSWWMSDSSHLYISNSQIYAMIVYGGFFEANNSTMRYLQVFGSASANALLSYVEGLTSFSSGEVIVSDSVTVSLYTRYQSLIQLFNSTYSYYTIYNESRVTVSWYLGVNVVDTYGTPAESANVTAYYSNAMVADSRLTGAMGSVRLTLMEKMLNATGEYPFGNYIVEAVYDTYSNSTAVNMTGNQQITLTLEARAFPTLIVAVIGIIALAVAVVIVYFIKFRK